MFSEIEKYVLGTAIAALIEYSEKKMYHSMYLISSIVALFIGSTCNMWHKRLTTLLFKYSGIGKTPAKIKEDSN